MTMQQSRGAYYTRLDWLSKVALLIIGLHKHIS